MNVLQKITVPQESVNDQYLTVVGMPFASGSLVKKDDIVIELETSKAVVTIEANIDGYLEYFCKLEEEVGINKLIAQITDTPDLVPVEDPSTKPDNVTDGPLSTVKIANTDGTQKQVFAGQPIFSEKAEKLIFENSINKNKFTNIDFVTEKAVLDILYPERLNSIPQVLQAPKAEIPKTPKVLPNEEAVSVTRLKPAKKREITYLSAVQEANLVSTIYMDIDLGSFFETVNPGLAYFKDSLLPVIIYEVSRLLIKYPMFNSFYHDGSLAHYKDINVGVAMDMDDGLKVVKIPNTNTRNLLEIEEELFNLSNKYLDKLLTAENLVDVTFTITDLSSQGAYFFTPLVNKDNAAILGISKVDEKLNRVLVSISFDHRVTEGKVATIFLRELKERIESYSLAAGKGPDLDKITCYKCMKRLKDDLNGAGFLKVVTQKGEEKLICESCLFRY